MVDQYGSHQPEVAFEHEMGLIYVDTFCDCKMYTLDVKDQVLKHKNKTKMKEWKYKDFYID